MGEVILTISNQKSDVGWKTSSYKLNEVEIEAKFKQFNILPTLLGAWFYYTESFSVNGVFLT